MNGKTGRDERGTCGPLNAQAAAVSPRPEQVPTFLKFFPLSRQAGRQASTQAGSSLMPACPALPCPDSQMRNKRSSTCLGKVDNLRLDGLTTTPSSKNNQ
ncbi:hypothetical protein CCHR01_19610 [Colletotrichum chrysophilum]|uniref:Uncharacterized protein n=1 Tax=Colletotrichum chrysophilum TaxID=1836956 RepID=A0AAD9E7Q2_9PEZI|nr:hypothetical protein CCHR01_19610 [Colletotrichum chrysophilum]